MEYVKI